MEKVIFDLAKKHETTRKFLRPLARPLFKALRKKYVKHIIFIPTYRCNYQCPYCSVWKLHSKFPERKASDWIRLFDKIPPSIIDITGGEPTLYDGFALLVSKLSKRHRFGMTTNLSYEINRFDSRIWKLFSSITLSFHPHYTNVDEFLPKALKLRKINSNISINIVAYPDQIQNLKYFIDVFNTLNGIRTHIDPFISDDYSYSSLEKKQVEEIRLYAGNDSTRKIGYDTEKVGKLCNAGINHVLFVPDGQVFQCMCGYFQDPERYVFADAFDWRYEIFKDDLTYCELSCSCGCDLDWVTIKDPLKP